MADQLRIAQEFVQSLAHNDTSKLYISNLHEQVLVNKTQNTYVTLAGVTLDIVGNTSYNGVQLSEMMVDLVTSGYPNSVNLSATTVDILAQNRYNALVGFLGFEIISRIIPPLSVAEELVEVIYAASGIKGSISESLVEVLKYNTPGTASNAQNVLSVLSYNGASQSRISQTYVSALVKGNENSVLRNSEVLLEIIRKNDKKGKWYKMLISY